MYRVRMPGYSKRDPAKRWALPDRVFFACGACHILAHAALERSRDPSLEVLWIRPVAGFTGNHVVVASADRVFDFHGVSDRASFLDHAWRRARRLWPGWEGTLVPFPREALLSEPASRAVGLWLREPGQFLHDPLPRAHRYIDRLRSSSGRAVEHCAERTRLSPEPVSITWARP